MATASNLINRDALDASLTTFRTVFEELFMSVANDAVVSAFCQEVSTEGGMTYQAQYQDVLGTWQEFIGAREYETARVSTLDTTLSTYVRSMLLPRKEVQYDKIGTVASRIRQWLSGQKNYKNILLHAELTSNSGKGPVCYDGSNLLDDDHAHGAAGAAWSNYGTAALTPLSFITTYDAMLSFKRENGEPFNVVPYALVAGPKLRTMALEITKGDLRAIGLSSATAEGGSTVAATAIGNESKGLVEFIQNQFITDHSWYLIAKDPSGQAKPFIFLKGSDVVEQIDVDMNSAFVQDNDAFKYGLLVDCRVAAGAPQTIFGNIVA